MNSVISEPPASWKGLRGFLSAELIQGEIDSSESKTFYTCGPYPVYDFCKVELQKLHIPRTRVKSEAPGPPDDVTKETGWPQGLSPHAEFQVEVMEQRTIKARAGEPLMNALERNGLVIPAVCRSGQCTTCRTKLLSGKVFMPSSVALLKADRQFGYIHPCTSYPVEDIHIRF